MVFELFFFDNVREVLTLTKEFCILVLTNNADVPIIHCEMYQSSLVLARA